MSRVIRRDVPPPGDRVTRIICHSSYGEHECRWVTKLACHDKCVRAIPEKTLEHWSSMYLARRFPACQLWWPSMDEDITVQSLSSRVGKSLLLEVKTTDWNWRRWEHRLTIDVDQLRRYQSSPIPVYYVLPMPPWSEVLNDGHSWLKGRHRSELIDHGHGWFGDWMFVTRAQTHVDLAGMEAEATVGDAFLKQRWPARPFEHLARTGALVAVARLLGGNVSLRVARHARDVHLSQRGLADRGWRRAEPTGARRESDRAAR